MLNIDEIQNGIVIDHIKAGTAIGLMDLLGIAGNRTARPPASTRPMTMGLTMVPMPHMQCSQLIWRLL